MEDSAEDYQTQEPAKPTAVHYALVFFALLSIINGMGWLLAFKGRDSIPDLRRQVSELGQHVNELRQQLAAARESEAKSQKADPGAAIDQGK